MNVRIVIENFFTGFFLNFVLIAVAN